MFTTKHVKFEIRYITITPLTIPKSFTVCTPLGLRAHGRTEGSGRKTESKTEYVSKL